MKPRPLISPNLGAALLRAGFGDLALRLLTAPRPTSYVRGFYADAEAMLAAEHEVAEIDRAWPGEAA